MNSIYNFFYEPKGPYTSNPLTLETLQNPSVKRNATIGLVAGAALAACGLAACRAAASGVLLGAPLLGSSVPVLWASYNLRQLSLNAAGIVNDQSRLPREKLSKNQILFQYPVDLIIYRDFNKKIKSHEGTPEEIARAQDLHGSNFSDRKFSEIKGTLETVEPIDKSDPFRPLKKRTEYKENLLAMQMIVTVSTVASVAAAVFCLATMTYGGIAGFVLGGLGLASSSFAGAIFGTVYHLAEKGKAAFSHTDQYLKTDVEPKEFDCHKFVNWLVHDLNLEIAPKEQVEEVKKMAQNLLPQKPKHN